MGVGGCGCGSQSGSNSAVSGWWEEGGNFSLPEKHFQQKMKNNCTITTSFNLSDTQQTELTHRQPNTVEYINENVSYYCSWRKMVFVCCLVNMIERNMNNSDEQKNCTKITNSQV